MWHATETHCLKLSPELLFTKYGLSYFMQTKKKIERRRERLLASGKHFL